MGMVLVEGKLWGLSMEEYIAIVERAVWVGKKGEPEMGG